MSHGGEIRVFAEVFDESGNHQLVLRYVDVTEPQDQTRAWNFQSLVWRQKHETSWTERKIISCADFQTGAKLRRWIANIGYLNAARGSATIEVGEEGLPDSDGVVRTAYSWREWDLFTGREIPAFWIYGE
jgi:hypothetical protein